MRIGLIDVDGHNFPNLPLMKISAWHKSRNDQVKWYEPLWDGIDEPLDVVYMSKVFSFSPEYQYPVNAKQIVRGGSGYCISLKDGKEYYDTSKDHNLSYEIEHIYPDYSIYPEMTQDTAYGFMSRGCPRGCSFCHVATKEGQMSYKVADLSEFWRGQKNIEILDPNVLACKEWKDILQQLIDSRAKVNFNQGLDIRMMTEEKAEMLGRIKQKVIHFAWDRYEDKDIIQPKFLQFRRISKKRNKELFVYVLCGDVERRLRDEDLERVYWLRENGYAPYITLYDVDNLPRDHELRRFRRYVNNRYIFWNVEKFEDYK